jgi:hypothetical protein
MTFKDIGDGQADGHHQKPKFLKPLQGIRRSPPLPNGTIP